MPIDRTESAEKGVFDMSSLDHITKTNPQQRAALVRLVSAVITTSGEDLAKARDCWIGGDKVVALKLLHTLRGAVGNLGAKRFAAATIALEQTIREGATGTADHFETAKLELTKTMLMAEAWIKQAQAPT